MSKKFCCEKFNYYGSGENGMGPNIRIVKYKGIIREKMLLSNPKANDKGFVMTSGYIKSIYEEEAKMFVITHCPFCGQKLSDFYKSDDYVQEVIG
jgi:hypothetical protein